MICKKRIYFQLEPSLRDSASAGKHNFIGKMAAVAEAHGFSVSYGSNSESHRHLAREDAYFLSHMKPTVSERGLVFRRVYHYPFWQIDQTAERWNWQVAKAEFCSSEVDPAQARSFFRFWQSRLFGSAPEKTSRSGYIFVPLQGKLLSHRSFQGCSPLEMIKDCLRFDPKRKIVATLHPKEKYSSAELAALEEIATINSRFSIEAGSFGNHLQTCDYVVTQNSGTAFNAHFFGKPIILFGKVDFHHIALNTQVIGTEAAFEMVSDHSPDYAGYIWWFLQLQAINAGRPDAEAKIADRLRQFGWL